jgi:hypothetical protein
MTVCVRVFVCAYLCVCFVCVCLFMCVFVCVFVCFIFVCLCVVSCVAPTYVLFRALCVLPCALARRICSCIVCATMTHACVVCWLVKDTR